MGGREREREKGGKKEEERRREVRRREKEKFDQGHMLLICLQAYKGVEQRTKDCSFLGLWITDPEVQRIWDRIYSLQGLPWACEFQRTRLIQQGTDLDFVGSSSCF